MTSAATQPQWGSSLTGSGVWGEFVLSSQHYFSPQVSMQCLELSDVGLPVCSMVYTSLHGWTWSPLNGFTSSLMRAQLQQEEWWALPSWSNPTKPFSFLNPGPFLLCFMLITEFELPSHGGSLKGKSMAKSWAEFGNGFGNRHWLRPKDIVCIPAA